MLRANDRQVRAIVDEIEERMRAGAKPVRREGEREGRWVLLDYVDLVIHVQQEEERVFYALERLWKDCPRVPLPEPVTAGDRGATVRRRGATLTVTRETGPRGGNDGAGATRTTSGRQAHSVAARPDRWNVEKRFQGQSDIPLDETGERQAERAARLLAALQPDAIVSSDLRRAAGTAAPLSRITGLPVTADKDLRERYGGLWEGLNDREIRERYPEAHAVWTPPEGESSAAVGDRVCAALERVAASLPETLASSSPRRDPPRNGAATRHARGVVAGSGRSPIARGRCSAWARQVAGARAQRGNPARAGAGRRSLTVPATGSAGAAGSRRRLRPRPRGSCTLARRQADAVAAEGL